MKKIIQSSIIALISIFTLTNSFAYCLGSKEDSVILFFLLAVAVIFFIEKKCKKLQISFSYKVLAIIFILFLFRASLIWLLDTFPLDDAEQVLLTLQMPTEGFSWIFINKYLVDIFSVFFIYALCLTPIFSNLTKAINSKKLYLISFVVILGINGLQIYDEIPWQDYYDSLKNDYKEPEHSDFWNKYYVNIDSVTIDAVDSTKNLIFIVMESMENYPSEYISQIEILSKNNLSFGFNDSLKTMIGGTDLASTSITIQALVAKTTGIPLLRKRAFGDTLLPKIKGIFNILNTFGYTNVFAQGTNGDFAGKRNFMLNHGINSFYDMNSFHNDMDENYSNLVSFSAGVTDKALYESAKQILDTLQHKKHFSLSLLTVETHFPYGFYDKNCIEKPQNKSEEELFKATLKCASREIYEFVDWVKSQNFFANTEIVIAGDHLFMGEYLTKGRERYWTNIFINPIRNVENRNRTFTSLDFAPTILESLGFDIKGHKMGFGVSLFATEPTLIEHFGKARLNDEMNKLKYSTEYLKIALPHD